MSIKKKKLLNKMSNGHFSPAYIVSVLIFILGLVSLYSYQWSHLYIVNLTSVLPCKAVTKAKILSFLQEESPKEVEKSN